MRPRLRVKSAAKPRHCGFLIPAGSMRRTAFQAHSCKSKPDRWAGFNLPESRTRSVWECKGRPRRPKGHMRPCEELAKGLSGAPGWQQPPGPSHAPCLSCSHTGNGAARALVAVLSATFLRSPEQGTPLLCPALQQQPTARTSVA